MVSMPPSIPVALPVMEVESSIKNEEAVTFSPAVNRVGKIVGSVAVGALGGYLFYGITFLIKRAGMIDKGVVIQPFPYILSGVISASLVETAQLIHDAALCALGEREKYENLAHPNEASTFDHLRQKTWTIINGVERFQNDIDNLYSRLFNIRTAEQIRKDFATEKDYFIKGDPRFMEVFRRTFWEQVDETLKTSVPQELSIYAVEALGYTIFSGHLFVWLYAVMFINGLVAKIGGNFEKIDEEQLKEYQRIQENKRTCDLLAALYPYEMAQMEAALADTKLQKKENEEGIEDEIDLTDVDYVSDGEFSSDDEGELSNQFVDPNVHAKEVQMAFILRQLDRYKFTNVFRFLESTVPAKLCEYKHAFDYCRSIYPIKEFPLPKPLFDKHGNEIENEDDKMAEIEKGNVPENFVLFGMEESA